MISYSNDLANQISIHLRSIYIEDNSPPMVDSISNLGSMNLPCITDIDQQNLMKLITVEELKEVVSGLPGKSAPRLDGYNANFFQCHYRFNSPRLN